MKNKRILEFVGFGIILLCFIFFGFTFSIAFILIIPICIGLLVYFILKISRNIYNKNKREISERTISKIADKIVYYKENKNVDIEKCIGEYSENLKNYIDIPKGMDLIKENDEIIIKYNNLVYNVNIGRYILSIV